MTDEKTYRVEIIVGGIEKVYPVQYGLSMEEAETIMQATIMDAQNGLYIPVRGGYPHAVNPKFIIEVRITGGTR